jgi:hypothetical protein
MIDKFGCILIFLTLLIVLIMYFQYSNVKKIEHFSSNPNSKDKLLIKKTNEYTKILKTNKFTIWLPKYIDNYFPTSCYATQSSKTPTFLSTLVKNEDNYSNDKPDKYEIISITKNNYAFWKPIPKKGYKSLGIVTSVDYPSKFSIRCVPEKFTNKTNIHKNISVDKINEADEGHELWSLNNSNGFVVNNLNNIDNLENMKNIFILDESKCSVEKKLYVKFTSKYKKLASYKDVKTQNDFFIWKPIPQQNFNIIGYLCLNKKYDPNNKVKTLVVHKSCTKAPINYGKTNILTLNVDGDGESELTYSFWRPTPPKNYFCLGDIIVENEEEPSDNNLIHCISLDYAKIINNSYKMIWNNINSKNSASIWVDTNNFFSINNGYGNPNKEYSLNEEFFYSDNDLLDDPKTILLNYRKNKNIIKDLPKDRFKNQLSQSLASKIDINENRIKNIIINNTNISVTFESKQAGTNQLKVIQILEKLNNILNIGDIKIYDDDKNNYYYTIDSFIIKNMDTENIIIDNSMFEKKYF